MHFGSKCLNLFYKGKWITKWRWAIGFFGECHAISQRCRFLPWLTESTVLHGCRHMGTGGGSWCIVFTNAVNSPLWSPLQLKMNVIHDGWQPGGTREACSLLQCVCGRSGDIFTLLPDKKNTLGCDCFRTINSRRRGTFSPPSIEFVWGHQRKWTWLKLCQRAFVLYWGSLRTLALWRFSRIRNEQPLSQMSAANPLTLNLCVIHSFTLVLC